MKAFLQSFNILTEEEINTFEQLLKPKKLKKNDFFIKEGSICREVAFVNSGIFRSFYYSSSGEEVTYCFTFPHNFVTAFSSFITQQPGPENIQALTNVELLTISREEVKKLEASSTNWLTLFKVMTEQEYLNMEKRIFLLQKESAEKRYEDLLIHHPEFLQTIPLNYLASYLGITQRHLSRIRGALAN